MSVIHTIGDSHCIFAMEGGGYPQNAEIKINDETKQKSHWLGPILCYSFGKENLKRCDIRKFDIKDNDTVIFCFGEIDCRCHIHKHITNENTYQKIIDNIVDNYTEAIKININVCEKKLKNICIYNVVPPIKKEGLANLSSEFPHLGTNEERKQYVLYFNKCIKKKCEENNWLFFDIYNDYCDDDGFLPKNIIWGDVHIFDGCHQIEFIKKYLL